MVNKENYKCLICFDTNQFFNGEEYIDCNHDPQVADLGLIQDEKQNNNLEEEQDEEEDL
jgi:hypothetical protein